MKRNFVRGCVYLLIFSFLIFVTRQIAIETAVYDYRSSNSKVRLQAKTMSKPLLVSIITSLEASTGVAEYRKECIKDALERNENVIGIERTEDLRGFRVTSKGFDDAKWGKNIGLLAVYTDLGIDEDMSAVIKAYADQYGTPVTYRCLRGDPERKTAFLAISGKMASGKTSLANAIVREFPQKRVAFVSNAGPLKEVAMFLCGMPPEEEKKDRPLLIELGDVVRKREVNRLVKMAVQKARLLAQWNDIVIVDDLRFKNEAPFLQGAGFKLLRLETDLEIRQQRIMEKYPATWKTHFEKLNSTSETQLDDYKEWDMVVNTTTQLPKSILFEIINL